MIERTTLTRTDSGQTVRELYELVAALDRRVPHLDRLEEVSIARAAAALKIEALKRIGELEREAPPADAL